MLSENRVMSTVLDAKKAETAEGSIYTELYCFRFTVVEGRSSPRASSVNEATDKDESEEGDGKAIPNLGVGGVKEIVRKDIDGDQ